MPRTQNSKPLSLEEKEKIKTFSASGKTPHAIAQLTNRSPHTIKRYLLCPDAQEQVKVIKTDLADMYEILARRMVVSISDEDILRINAYQRTLSSAVATDKMRLLTDQSTSNIDARVAVAELNKIIKEGQRVLDMGEGEGDG